MANSRNRHPARRRFLKQAAALSAGAAAVGAPLLVLASPADAGHAHAGRDDTSGPAAAAREADAGSSPDALQPGPSASPRRPPRARGPL